MLSSPYTRLDAPPATHAGAVSQDRYRQMRTNAFGSPLSLRHFMQRHWARLVSEGALVREQGEWLIRVDAFDAAVLSLGRHPAARTRRG